MNKELVTFSNLRVYDLILAIKKAEKFISTSDVAMPKGTEYVVLGGLNNKLYYTQSDFVPATIVGTGYIVLETSLLETLKKFNETDTLHTRWKHNTYRMVMNQNYQLVFNLFDKSVVRLTDLYNKMTGKDLC